MNLKTALKSKGELRDQYMISEQFLDQLVGRAFLKPKLVNDEPFFDEDDQLRLEVVIKGKDLGFSLEEIAELIKKVAPMLDGIRTF